jgi:tetratricopeptide (TPR) repeat protein
MTREERFRMRHVQRMLGVSRTVITQLVAGGFVQPARGHGRETLFSFRDVVMLRTAHSLRKAGIPPRKIVRALENLRATWSPHKDLTAICIAAVGADVAVQDRDGPWDAHTGQLLLDFEPTPACGGTGNVTEIQKRRAPDESADAAAREAEGNVDGAEAAYRRAIESDRTYLDAYLSLGGLLSECGRYDDAIEVWRSALLENPDHHLLHFNLGVAPEDSGRLEQALIAYRGGIELKRDFATSTRRASMKNWASRPMQSATTTPIGH